MPFSPGDSVHVAALGNAIVREVRTRGRYLVELKGRTMVVAEAQLAAVERPKRARSARSPAAHPAAAPPSAKSASAPALIDLHGMTTAEAVAALDAFLNDAILASHGEVTIIHGRSGGSLKDAVHARLRQLPSVRAFCVDARNAGVTMVRL